MTPEDKKFERIAQRHIADLKKSSKAITEDAAVRAVHKVMAEFSQGANTEAKVEYHTTMIQCPHCDGSVRVQAQPHPDNFIHALMYDVAKRDSEALAEQPAQQEPVYVPVTDNTYNYAKSLAEAIFKRHFASDEHYASGRIVWGVNDTVIGILTQIDNMVADMVRRPAQQQEPVAWRTKNAAPPGGYVVFQQYPQAVANLGGAIEPLYTSPPASKPWVGLTDEEIGVLTVFDGLHHVEVPLLADFVRTIEAKLREKNA